MMGYGSILLLALVIGVMFGAFFSFVMVIVVPFHYATDSTIIGQTVRLTEFMPGTDSAIVHAEIVIVVDRNVKLILGGGVADLRLDKISGATNIELNDVKAVSYDGPLVLNGPASAGDEIELVIRHGASETAVTATLEAAT